MERFFFADIADSNTSIIHIIGDVHLLNVLNFNLETR